MSSCFNTFRKISAEDWVQINCFGILKVFTFSWLADSEEIGRERFNQQMSWDYPPNKTGDARKLMLQLCLKGFSTTETLTQKNSEQNDSVQDSDNFLLHQLCDLSFTRCKPHVPAGVNTKILLSADYNRPLTCCLDMHIDDNQPWSVMAMPDNNRLHPSSFILSRASWQKKKTIHRVDVS